MTLNDRDIGDSFKRRISEHDHALTPAARRVVQFIDQNRGVALASSALDLASKSGTSDATVVRVVQALGFKGLHDLKLELAAAIDAKGTSAENLQRTLREVGSDAGRAVDAALRTHAAGVAALMRPTIRKTIIEAVGALDPGKRIVLFGVGPTSGITRYASVLLGRSGREILMLDATGGFLADQLLRLKPGDVLLALAYLPRYREVQVVFQEARRLGLPIVLMTDDAKSELAKFADVVVAAPRGRHGHVALHGTTIACLDAIILGLSAVDATATLSTANQLTDLRRSLASNMS